MHERGDSKLKFALVYHFFALYRRPVVTALHAEDDLQVVLVADRKNRFMSGVPVWVVPDDIEFRQARCFRMARDFMLQRGILRLAFDRNLQGIVYLGDWKWPMTWLSALVARMMGKRVLFWTHGWRKAPRGFQRIILNVFYRIPHGLLLYGNRAREIALSNGFDSRRLYVVFNSLDNDLHVRLRTLDNRVQIKQTRLELFGESDVPVVICSSRISKRKRLDVLFQAVHQLKKRGHAVNVILIGDGPERASLQQLARNLAIQVHFAGACFDEESIARMTLASNATVSPGASGLTVVQSLTFGRPVITGDSLDEHGPEVEAIISGITGDFFRAGDTQDLARLIEDYTRTPFADESRVEACQRVIDTYYNPHYQASVFRRALHGEDAQVVNLRDALPPRRTVTFPSMAEVFGVDGTGVSSDNYVSGEP